MRMLRTTSKVFPAEKKMMSDIPYILRLDFGALEEETRKIVGKPIACYKCNGFLLSTDQIEEDEKVGKHFICPFCGTLNIVEGEIITAGDDTDFVIETPPERTDSSEDAFKQVGETFLALLDVSGSMAGVNLAAVKRSLTTSIESLATNAPNTKIGFIEFEGNVLFRDLVTGKEIILPHHCYTSYDMIQKETADLLDHIQFAEVGENVNKIKKHLASLQVKGATALGPALAMGFAIIKNYKASRVVLLTDGLANVGIGALEGYQVTPAFQFYQDLGQQFRDIGAVVDVVGIASGAGMELKTLGLLPESTGGQMYYVTPNELDGYMSELTGVSLLGRDVSVRLITPSGVRIKDASGVSRAVIADLKANAEGKIGGVGEKHELYFEVEPEQRIEKDEIPIQVQVSYTDAEGARKVRAVTTKLRVTRDKEEILKDFDPSIAATFVTQKAGEESFAGERAEGRRRIANFRAVMKKQARNSPKALQAELGEIDRVLAKEEDEIERLNDMMNEAPNWAPSAAADQAYASGLQQMRRSSKEMFQKKKTEEEEK